MSTREATVDTITLLVICLTCEQEVRLCDASAHMTSSHGMLSW